MVRDKGGVSSQPGWSLDVFRYTVRGGTWAVRWNSSNPEIQVVAVGQVEFCNSHYRYPGSELPGHALQLHPVVCSYGKGE